MQKILYRIVILILVFFLSVAFFIATMKENSQTREIETTEMSDVSFPVVSVRKGEDEINFMYGFVKDIFSLGIREDITPISPDEELKFQLYENGNDISFVEYELNNRIEHIVIETGEAKLEKASQESENSLIGLKLSYNVSPDTEYGLKLILINKDGKKLYYYTTLKYMKEDSFQKNIRFIKDLERDIFRKENKEVVKKYLETDGSMDNMNFNHVNIHSSYDVVTWGNLMPKKVTEPKIRVLENNESSTALLYKYVVEVGKENKNYYFVTEYYRVNATERETYLLAFDRRVEEVYQPEKTSIGKKQIKLGIANKDVDYLVSEDLRYLNFVRERELWQYDTKENMVNKVFTFRKNAFQEEREILDHHKIKILKADGNGDLYFVVYGYMNRGVYEGRSGLVLYKYFSLEKRIEEQVYIPIDKMYQELLEDFDGFSYFSKDEFFYFILDGVLYSYSLGKRKIEVLASKVEKNTYFPLKEESVLVWQEEDGRGIQILDLETRKKVELKGEEGKELNLFGTIDDNLIYGISRNKDRQKQKDGSFIIPNEILLIADITGKELKRYQKNKIYVTDIKVDNHVIHLRRMKKTASGLAPYSQDQILNNIVKQTDEISVIDRRTEKYLTEYYLKLPKEMILETLPTSFLEVKNTVILSTTTARMPEMEEKATKYYANIYGRISRSSAKATEMIRLANQGMGYVIDSHGTVIWERGNTKYADRAEEVDVDYADPEDSAKEAVVRLFLTTKGIYISESELKNSSLGILELLNTQPEIKALDLTGITLEESLYYVGRGNPVITMLGDRPVLIIGYNTKNVTIMDTKTLKTEVILKEDFIKQLEKSGNIFISVVG